MIRLILYVFLPAVICVGFMRNSLENVGITACGLLVYAILVMVFIPQKSIDQLNPEN